MRTEWQRNFQYQLASSNTKYWKVYPRERCISNKEVRCQIAEQCVREYYRYHHQSIKSLSNDHITVWFNNGPAVFSLKPYYEAYEVKSDTKAEDPQRENDTDFLVEFFSKLASQQQPLPREYTRIIYENWWDLLEE